MSDGINISNCQSYTLGGTATENIRRIEAILGEVSKSLEVEPHPEKTKHDCFIYGCAGEDKGGILKVGRMSIKT